MSSHLEVALRYAGWGLRVFPVRPRGKAPAIPSTHPKGDPQRGTCRGDCGRDGHGCHDGTTDLDRIRAWWRRWPHANIGIATGPESGIVVLDIDPRHGGLESLAKLEAEHAGEEPLLTREAGTPTGGTHLWFRYPEGEHIGNSAGKLGDGLDIRGTGGFVVAPPSQRPEGLYQWLDGHRRIEPCPEWFLKLLQATPAPDGEQPLPPRLAGKLTGQDRVADPVVRTAYQRDQASRYQRQFEGVLSWLAKQQEGNRNSGLYWSACRLRELADGGAPAAWVDLARETLQETARRIGIPERDIPRTISSGLRGRT